MKKTQKEALNQAIQDMKAEGLKIKEELLTGVNLISFPVYANINIYNPEINKKEVKKIRMNVLVAKEFIPIPEHLKDKPNIVVDHIDGDKKNNYYENLQYITASDNNLKG